MKITDALIRRFVDKPEEYELEDVRLQYGKLTGFVGLFINLLLAATKFVGGYLTGSVALMGDAANNFSDCGSSIVTLFGFKLSSQPPDRKHPYGHARSEYIFSSVVAIAVIVVAVQLFINSIQRIRNPEVVEFTPFAIGVMVMAIVLKTWLFFFYRQVGKKIKSDILRAQAVDSIADVGSSGAVFISLLLSPVIGFDLDGYMGLIVSLLVIKSGFEILVDNYNSLLGEAPTQEEIQKIAKFILSYDNVIDIHDLVIHEYGGSHRFATVHVEVSAYEDWVKNHEIIDQMEQRAREELNLELVVHMDPIIGKEDNPKIYRMQEEVRSVVKDYNEHFDIHDFRLLNSYTKPLILFDVDVPSNTKASNEEINSVLTKRILDLVPQGKVRFRIDRQVFSPTPRRNWTEETFQEALENDEEEKD